MAEVTSLGDSRLSINGWFHTKTPPVFETPLYNPPEGLFGKTALKAKEVDIELESWINEDYLEVGAITVIQKQIEDNSEISLDNFFKEESFREILQILQSKGNFLIVNSVLLDNLHFFRNKLSSVKTLCLLRRPWKSDKYIKLT